MSENKHKHLEFIQTAVERMSSNLFLLKGWTVTLIAGLFALSSKDADRSYFAIAYLATILFWLLDGYFLSLERSYRAHYDHVRRLDEASVDFSMDVGRYRKTWRNSWAGALFSPTLLVYYGGLGLIMLSVVHVFVAEKTGG